MTTTLNALTSSSGLAVSPDSSGVLQLQSNGTPTVTVDTSGNVGIGTSSPYYKLSVNSSNGINSYNGVSGLGKFVLGDPIDPTGYVGMYRGSAGDPNTAGNDLSLGSYGIITFRNGAASFGSQTERARIDSSGNLLVNKTGQVQNGKLTVGADLSVATGAVIQNINGTAQNYFMIFANSGSAIAGSISHTGSTTVAFNTSSDYRLKKDVQPMQNALDKVSALKPCTYKWIEDDTEGEGFIAHELQEVCPHAVTGSKDAVDADGNIIPQGIDTSFLVATLTAAIQELNAKFEEYKATHP